MGYGPGLMRCRHCFHVLTAETLRTCGALHCPHTTALQKAEALFRTPEPVEDRAPARPRGSVPSMGTA